MQPTYYERLTEAMTFLGREHSAVFVGQSVRAGGTGMTATLKGVPNEQKIEVPVFEDTQLGICTGLALDGYLPVCIFPRINFLLLAMSQLVLHLDAIPRFSSYWPKVIIRTMVATPRPLDPGAQHLGDYSDQIEQMLRRTMVLRLLWCRDIEQAYRRAAREKHSTIIVEYAAKYEDRE